MIFWVWSKPTWIRLIYSMEQQQWRTGRLQSKKTTEYKRICSEVSVNSLGNPCSQSGRRKGSLRWEGFVEKESFKPGVEEWRGNEWWKWWVDGTGGGSATERTGWCKSGEISAWLTKGMPGVGSRDEGSLMEGTICYSQRRWCGWTSECDQRWRASAERRLSCDWWGYADMKVGWLWQLYSENVKLQ